MYVRAGESDIYLSQITFFRKETSNIGITVPNLLTTGFSSNFFFFAHLSLIRSIDLDNF